MTLARAYLETPARRMARWGGSAGMIVALHVAAGALAFLFWPNEAPRDEQQPGAIMMELESLAAESPSEQQDIAEQPMFDKSAPPPSPTESPEETPPQAAPAEPVPEKVAEAAPEPVPEAQPEETPKVEEAPLAPEPEVTLPKETPKEKPKEKPPEEKPVERPEAKKEEPVKKPKEKVEKAEKARETKAAQKSDSKQQRQAAASAKGRFDPNPIYRPSPVYPAGARAQKIQGRVIVSYSVSPSGAVSNVRVVSASPPGIFNAAAVAAVRQWRFKPSAQGGTRRQPISFRLK